MNDYNNLEILKEKEPKRKLEFELIPSSSWYNNLRKIFTKRQWVEISKAVRKNANGRCEICGRKVNKLHAHETWEFFKDSEQCKNVQKLVKIRAVCPLCHSTIHIGRTACLGNEETALKWYAKVNNISLHQTVLDEKKALDIFEARSKLNWDIDINEDYLQTLISNNKKQKIKN